MHKSIVIPAMVVLSMLSACTAQEAAAPEAAGDPRVQAEASGAASAHVAEAHRTARAELDAALKTAPDDADFRTEQSTWQANLVSSCETVTPEDERLGCETRLMQARVTSLRERFAD